MIVTSEEVRDIIIYLNVVVPVLTDTSFCHFYDIAAQTENQQLRDYVTAFRGRGNSSSN